jgi:hypothetical protein
MEYSKIIKQAKTYVNNVEKKYALGGTTKWAYYFAKSILNPKKNIKSIAFDEAPNPSGTHISRDIYKSSYIDMAERLVKFVESKGNLPNNIRYTTKSNKEYLVTTRVYTLLFAKILVYYDKNGKFPQPVNITSKAFKKPDEPSNEVFAYFEKVFGKIDCIDDALDYMGRYGTYGYYYDDVYSNKQSIDRMRNGQGVNCTDSLQVLWNLMQEFIKRGKYKKCTVLHVLCSGGDGHVRMSITANDGSVFYRDSACTLENGTYCNWCTSGYTLLATDPYWFMQNVNR